MEINWFTVIAQVINFLVLVWLLKRFLYKPVLQAVDEREKKIAAQLNDAASQKKAAQKEHELFQQKLETFDKERAGNLDKVQEEGKQEKQKLLEQARAEYDTLRAKLQNALQEEQENLVSSIKRNTQDEVFAIANKVLADLASVSLEEQLVQVFIQRLQHLTEEEKTAFKDALNETDQVVTIKCAFQLSSPLKSDLEKTLADITGETFTFQYMVSPELVSGIEINTGSYKLSWNIDAYLDVLKQNLITSFNEKNKATEHATG